MGVAPARGNISATKPSSTTIEISARSVKVRPHGGNTISSTQQAMNPTGGNTHRSKTDTNVTAAQMTLCRLPLE